MSRASRSRNPDRQSKLVRSLRGLFRRGADRPAALGGLPLVEHRVDRPGRTFAFIFTGDGNWAVLVNGLARELAARGIPSVGLKARTYLLRRRTPDEVARHVEAVLRHYLSAWETDEVVLIGLSRGADMLPFAVRRMPAQLRKRVRLMALFSPGHTTNFRFYWSDLFGWHPRADDVPLLPELRAIRGVPILCVNGTGDPSALCPHLPAGIAECVSVEAGHNLDRDHLLAAELVLERVESARPRAAVAR